MKKFFTNLILVLTGAYIMSFCFKYLANATSGEQDRIFLELKGIIRIIVSLSAAAISVAIPGFIELVDGEIKGSPGIKASGALAVFALVYLFNPI